MFFIVCVQIFPKMFGGLKKTYYLCTRFKELSTTARFFR